MHGTLPPIVIDGPGHPRCFENLAVRHCPEYADTICGKCAGHGGWNVKLESSMRHASVGCDVCGGDGWVERDGEHHIADIVVINGRPQWVITLVPDAGFEMRPKALKPPPTST